MQPSSRSMAFLASTAALEGAAKSRRRLPCRFCRMGVLARSGVFLASGLERFISSPLCSHGLSDSDK